MITLPNHHIKTQLSWWILTTLFAWLSFASPVNADSSLEASIAQAIEVKMNGLIAKLNQNQAVYRQDHAQFYRDLNQELSQIINFDRIARKVMGKHGRHASDEQLEAFTQAFKLSLYKAYASALLDNSEVTTKVLEAKVNSRNPKKAKVSLELSTATGARYDVIYSMHRDKDNQYRVENIIVMGINLGLAFKDQFQARIKEHKGSINALIENWAVSDSHESGDKDKAA